MSSFPERFTELLNNSNLNYEEVARALNIKSKGTISKYASGTIKRIDLSLIEDIANLFNVSPIWLLGYTNNKNYIIEDQ